jgi:hypothetical protein
MADNWAPRVVRYAEGMSELILGLDCSIEDVLAYAKSADLRKARTNPEVLAPCDIVYLPPKPTPRTFTLRLGSTNTFTSDIPLKTVSMRLQGMDGMPMAGVPFRVDVGGTSTSGTTRGDGTVQFDAPLRVRRATVTLPDHGVELNVAINALDPLETMSGALGRLANLGYYYPELRDDDLETAYRASVFESFQEDFGLEVTGQLDAPTRRKLGDLVGEDRA